jgi:uncharacterized protein YidB (DUF937 family)
MGFASLNPPYALSEDLPSFVDQLIPEGRLPSEDEAGQGCEGVVRHLGSRLSE